MTPAELSKQAKKLYDKEAYSQAAETYERASQEYENSGDLLIAAEMRNNSSVSWLLAGEAQKSLDASANTDQIFFNADDRRRQAMALGNQAAAHEGLKQLKEAAEKYEQASDILKEIGETDLRAYVLQKLSALQLRTGDQFQSVATMHTALENKKKLSLKEKFLKRVLRIPFKKMG